jgi:hypothetical protein
MVTVKRADVVAIAELLQFKAASKWNKTRMLEKLASIAETAKEDGLAVEDPRLNGILQEILAADGKVDVVSGDPVQAEDTPQTEQEKKDEAEAPAVNTQILYGSGYPR